MTQLPIPVHIGSKPLDYWDDIEARQREHGDEVTPWLREQRRPAIASPDHDWAALGIESRWIGFDSADCVAALQPGFLSGDGDTEFTRFRQGAKSRGEAAIVISLIGEVDDDSRVNRNAFGPPTDTVFVGDSHTQIHGTVLGKGAVVRPVAGLAEVDKQLALRLLNCNPPPRWRSLSISGTRMVSSYGREDYPAEGSLIPIVETELGEPVVACWISPDDLERRYIVPFETPWSLLLSWLMEQALPEFVPGAFRRARRQLTTESAMMTRSERKARQALADLEADYLSRRHELRDQLSAAQKSASGTREGLLYGTGQQLVEAVRAVLQFAGIVVADLDAALGATTNADLLCSFDGRHRLVEVKAASGNASERAYEDLVRHLREWPTLTASVPVEGGVLILNHQHRRAPGDRDRRPYGRAEFLTAQEELVVPTLDLFDAWREEDAVSIRSLLFDPRSLETPELPMAVDAHVTDEPTSDGQRRWFGRRPRT